MDKAPEPCRFEGFYEGLFPGLGWCLLMILRPLLPQNEAAKRAGEAWLRVEVEGAL